MADEIKGRVSVDINEEPIIEGSKRAAKAMVDAEKKIDAASQGIVKDLAEIGNAAQKSADKTVDAAKKTANAEKLIRERGRVNRSTLRTRTAGNIEEIKERKSSNLVLEMARRNTNLLTIEGRKQVIEFEHSERRKTDALKREQRERERIYREDIKRLGPMSQQWQSVMASSIGRSNSAYMLGMKASATGLTPSQIWQQQMNQAVARSNAAGAAAMIPGWVPPGAGGGRGGGNRFGAFGRLMGMGGGGLAGNLVAGISSGIGIGIGGYGLVNATQRLVEGAEQATAYQRQMVAARQLAGSQEELNALLEAYTVASGGAINQTTTLANVTRLLSTGYAETAPEVEKFVRATRGASLALGRPQDYVIQETQLAISNTSIKRLDQIGLGIEEVNERIEKLRSTNQGWTREMAFQDAVLSLMLEKYGALANSAEGQATSIEKLKKAWADLGLEIGKANQGWLNDVSELVTAVINPQSNVNQAIQQGVSTRDRALFKYLDATGLSALERFRTGKTETQMQAQRVLQNPGAFNWPSNVGRGDMPGDIPRNIPVPTLPEEDELAVRRTAYQAILDLERDTGRQRLQMIADYENQRTNLVANFAKQMVREEEDFNRQRARSLRDYERSIMDTLRDAREREAEWQEDLDERIADLREDSNERLAELEEDYQKDREKAERQHRDRLLKAAGQLDAIAVLEERKRFREENKERQEAHGEAKDKLRENLQEQIDEANEAHQKRLEDAREADAKRLEDMRINRERQLADEDEDREIRRERAIEDHNQQLAEMDRIHEERLIKLQEQAEEERKAIEERMNADLDELGVYIAGYKEQMLERDKMIDQWFDGVIKRLEKEIKEEQESTYRYDPKSGPQIPLHYQRGGYASQTGLAFLHAGEFVLSRDMLAAGWSPGNQNSYSDSRSFVIESGAISVQTAPGYEHLVGELIEQKFVEILERV